MSKIIINGKDVSSLGYTATGAKFIYALAYAYHSSERDPVTGKIHIPCDEDNHLDLLSQVESVEIFLTESIGAVGQALAAQRDLDQDAVSNIGYLISGLVDFQVLVASSKHVIEQSLKSITEQAQKSPNK